MIRSNQPIESEEKWREFAIMASIDINPPCDGDLKQTITLLRKLEINEKRGIEFLRKNGGYCDCEVVMNFAIPFQEKMKEVLCN